MMSVSTILILRENLNLLSLHIISNYNNTVRKRDCNLSKNKKINQRLIFKYIQLQYHIPMSYNHFKYIK